MSAKLWIDLAKSDLKSSKLLYANRHYRTSYFFFQQATEKANKAFALLFNFGSEETFREVSHNQFKLLRRYLSGKQKEIEGLIQVMDPFPQIKGNRISKLLQLQKQHESFSEGVRLIDSLKSRDLVNLSSIEINSFFRELKKSRFLKIKLPKNFDAEAKAMINQLIEWISQFKTPEATNAKTQFEELAKNKQKLKKVYELVAPGFNNVINFVFSGYVLNVCALMTVQHSSLTRYPQKGLNPLEIYKLKLPIVKKQSQFMELLDDALNKMTVLEKIN